VIAARHYATFVPMLVRVANVASRY